MLPGNSVGKSSLPLGDSLENLAISCLVTHLPWPPPFHIPPLLIVFPHLNLPFIPYLAFIHNRQRDSTKQEDMELKELQQEHEGHRLLWPGKRRVLLGSWRNGRPGGWNRCTQVKSTRAVDSWPYGSSCLSCCSRPQCTPQLLPLTTTFGVPRHSSGFRIVCCSKWRGLFFSANWGWIKNSLTCDFPNQFFILLLLF